MKDLFHSLLDAAWYGHWSLFWIALFCVLTLIVFVWMSAAKAKKDQATIKKSIEALEALKKLESGEKSEKKGDLPWQAMHVILILGVATLIALKFKRPVIPPINTFADFSLRIVNTTLVHTSDGSTMRFISNGTVLYSRRDLGALHNLNTAEIYHWFWSQDDQVCILRFKARSTNNPDNCTEIERTGLKQIRFDRFPISANQLRWAIRNKR